MHLQADQLQTTKRTMMPIQTVVTAVVKRTILHPPHPSLLPLILMRPSIYRWCLNTRKLAHLYLCTARVILITMLEKFEGKGEKGSYDVKKMRASSFTFPVIQDISRINTSQLICKLTIRDVQRGCYKFVEALEQYYVR